MMTGGDVQPEKIRNVELGRGLAALAVVFFHANATMAFIGGPDVPWMRLGEHGVDFFFVLSGFIIFHAHSGDIGKPYKFTDYIVKRIVRIIPMLWIIVTVVCLAKVLFSSVALTASQIFSSLLLYPSLQEPIPAVVWTLRHEAIFYVAFAGIILSKRLGLVIFALWLFCCLTQMFLVLNGTPITGLASFFFYSLQIEFFLCELLSHFVTRRSRSSSRNPILLALPILAALLLIESEFGISRSSLTDYTSFASTFWTVALGSAFAAVLYGLLRLEGLLRIHRFWVLLGGASYSIYLVHTFSNTIMQRALVHFPAGVQENFGHVLLVVAGVSAGIALHLFIEKPLTRKLRQALLRSTPQRVNLQLHEAG
jgi:peptidoglycan/LPS O-acetylase OafA/YrhL